MRITKVFFSVSGVYAFGLVFSILANILLARWLSVADFGRYSFAIAIATFAAIPVSVGLPLLLTREVAQAAEAHDPRGFWRVLSVAATWVVLASGLVMLGLLGALALGLVTQEMEAPLRIVMFLPLVMGVIALCGGTLKGLGLPVFSEVLAQVIAPALLVLGIGVLYWMALADTPGALSMHLLGYSIAALTGLVLVLRKVPGRASFVSADRVQLRSWGIAFVSFTLIGGMGTLTTQLSTLVLGGLGQTEELAYLRVAERGAQLVAFPLMFVNAVIGPYIVRARAEGPEALRDLARHAARLSTLTALPLVVVFALFGKPLIAMTFGAPYDDTAWLPMMIMSVGQVIAMAFGSGGMFLAMCGHEKTNIIVLVSMMLSTLAGVALLAPPFGASGAAIGVFLGLLVGKIFAAVMCRVRLGFSPSI